MPGLCALDSGYRGERVLPLLTAPKIRNLENVPESFLRTGLLWGQTTNLILK